MSAVWNLLSDPASWTGPGGLLQRLAEHAAYSATATLIAAVLALPLALWIGHTGRGGLLAIQIANAGRAIPTFGLLVAAFVAFGYGVIPVYVALVALAIPPIMTNTYIGVREVDADVREAAQGMGMSGWQVLTRVELPVALPLIMAGVRTSAVQVVATATLAAVVGLGGLGRPVVDGLARGPIFNPNARALVIVGAVFVALLAVLTEVAVGLLERRLTPAGLRRGRRGGRQLENSPATAT